MCGKLKNSSPKKSPKAAGSADAPWLVVGLGNPGAQYETTRHNIGYLAVDELLDDLTPMPGTLSAHKRTNSLICQTKIDGQSVIIARARSYMNLSGGAIGALAKFFKVPAEHVIVIHDELDLDPAAVRIKVGGGENGHNGLKSTTQALGTRDYVRIRMGIGRPPGRMDPASFVLKPFSKQELEWLPLSLGDAADAVRLIVSRGVAIAQNEIHGRSR
ncbi:aminoacyl-tRNA hydrolase [Corynebacterium urealyticum]|uniref:aminoacyl-tRNA hydrolase n=1 Tax=Corynebacterium urealyticum TaxID=43771 RepID=UPI0011E6EB5B|nr:aminoacyl-tRNA hydrolase [Corynebacterium urealyticum]TYR17986.1 aminoacyl-tRNA hydrolase [Corynebacterium urealyticum]